MGDSKSKNEEPKKKRRLDPELLKKGLKCDLDQYDMLKRCSEKKDVTEWNEWRKAHPEEDILLEDAKFSQCYLRGVYLNKGGIYDRSVDIYFSGEVYLEGAKLLFAKLQGAKLLDANLQGAKLLDANLQDANLFGAKLQDADLRFANLQGAELRYANLQGANLLDANLQGAFLWRANLQGADFTTAIVDGATLLWECGVNKHKGEEERGTNFKGVGIESTRIDYATKQLLQYNIRRMNWENWYKEHWFWRWPVWLFWAMSDYGRSTGRIIAWFFGLAAAFALVYWLWPDLVIVNKVVGDIRGFWQGLYFSVVTMTTLGFGDIAANPNSWGGQTLLMVQVILGYVLLGALVTRFAVLFMAGGPAGKFADEKKKKPQSHKK
jgi:uncharacterized protein YjbI with pentapeptide repeats